MGDCKFLRAAQTGAAYVTSAGESNNATTTPQDKIDETVPVLEAGDYLVMFYCEAKTDTPDTSTCRVKVLVDGVEKAETNVHINQYHHFSGNVICPFDAGETPRIQLQFLRVGAAAIVTVRRAFIALTPFTKVN